jgi:hypothetical protein
MWGVCSVYNPYPPWQDRGARVGCPKCEDLGSSPDFSPRNLDKCWLNISTP